MVAVATAVKVALSDGVLLYDKASNRTSQTYDAQTTDYTYNDNNELTPWDWRAPRPMITTPPAT